MALLVLVSAAGVFAGTQLDDGDSSAASDTRRVRPDGSLTVDPKPLSLADVERQPAGSARRAVIQLWYWAQWGSTPNVVAAYAPAIVTALSATDVAGAYSQKRASMVTSQPRIVDEVKGAGDDTVVLVQALRRNSPPENLSFTLVNDTDGWKIVSDTLLEDAIAAYVQFRNTPDPNSTTVPPSAARAGVEAARRYRTAAIAEDYQPSSGGGGKPGSDDQAAP